MIEGVITLVSVGVMIDAYFHWKNTSGILEDITREEYLELCVSVNSLEQENQLLVAQINSLEKRLAKIEKSE